MTTLTTRWPSQEPFTFLTDLTAIECKESHAILDFCFQFQIKKIHKGYEGNCEKNFISTIHALFMTFHYSPCSCTYKIFEERLRNYRQLYPNASGLIYELLVKPVEIRAEAGSIQAVNDAFKETVWAMPNLRFTMSCGRTLKVDVAPNPAAEQVVTNVQKVECRILRHTMLLDCLHHYSHSQLDNTVRLSSMIFFSQLAAGVGFLPAVLGGLAGVGIYQAVKNKAFINRSKPEDLTYTPLKPYLSVAYDNWSSGYRGRMTLQKSTSWGYLRLQAGNSQPTFIPFDFSSYAVAPVSPQEIWNLCNWLVWAYKNHYLSFKDLTTTWALLQEPLFGCSDRVRSIFNDVNLTILQSSMSLCLSNELLEGKFNELLSEKEATLTYDEILPFIDELPAKG